MNGYAPEAGSPVVPALRASGISKTFGGERALDDMSLTVGPSEVHGLLGANGSGKSTFIKIIAGYHVPDSGSLEVGGVAVPLPMTVRQRRAAGLEFVHQDLGLVQSLSVAENLTTHDIVNPPNKLFISQARQRAKTRAVLARYHLDFDPAAAVSELRPLERAMLAIVRAVEGLRTVTAELGHGGVLVLDEPTVFLPKDGAEVLFGLVRDIAAAGSSVIFVSHKLEEVAQVTDRISILRDGRVVYTGATRDTDEATIVKHIVGHALSDTATKTHTPPSGGRSVALRGASGGRLRETSFEVRAGEIVGLTGLVGSGFEEIPYILIGTSPDGRGELEIQGASLSLADQTPWRAAAAGIALVPADRQRDGGVLTLTVEDNLLLPVLKKYQRGPIQRRQAMKGDALRQLKDFGVQPQEPTLEYANLSGGNQQKVLLAKWLQTRPKLLVLHEPTQGVDVGAREQIHALIRKVAAEGMAVICASSDYDQVALLCDRVLIFADGRMSRELSGAAVTKERIAEHSYGGALRVPLPAETDTPNPPTERLA